MSSFTFVHAADLHLDTQIAGLRIGASQARTALPRGMEEAMRDASFAAWDALVDLTLRRRALFLLLAGDIYDGAERGVRAQFRFLHGLERLAAAGVRTFIVHGNHDPLGGWSAIRAWPEGVTIFGAGEVGRVALPGATIYGVSYDRRDVRENLALRFRRGPEAGLHIGLLHANAGDNSEHAPYSPCTIEDLAGRGMDYWALGHVHRHRILRSGDPWIVYPGCLQGRSIHAGEQDAKGAVVVDVEEGRLRAPEFVPLDAFRFISFELDSSEYEDLNLLGAALRVAAEGHRDANPGRGLILRATLTGRGRIHADLRREGARDGLLGELRAAFAEGEPRIWWNDLADDTRPEHDFAALRNRGDFVSELLDLADAVATDRTRLGALLAPRLRALDALGIPADLQPDDDDGWIDRAIRIALDRLDEAADP